MFRSKSLTRKAQRQGTWSPIIIGLTFFLFGSVILYVSTLRPLWLGFQAKDWERVPAVVEQSEVEVDRGEDGDTYRVHIRYRYRFNGRIYLSDRYQFFDAYSSGRESKQRIVEHYPPGAEVRAFVNPAAPQEAVIQREIRGDSWWIALLSVIFPLFGIGAIYKGIKQRNAARQQALSGIGSLHTAGPFAAAPARRTAVVSRKRKFLGMLVFALFWNGIVSVFLNDFFQSWLNGSPDYFHATLFITFVLVGLGFIAGTVYFFFGMFNPTTTVIFKNVAPRLGGRVALNWEMQGKVSRIRRLEITLEGQEKAIYQRGSSTVTETHTFALIELFSGDARMSNLACGSAAAKIPENLMHSFNAKSNKIIWTVHLRGEIPRWPDVDDEYPVEVLPLGVPG